MQESRRKPSRRKASLEVVPSQRLVDVGQIAVDVGAEFRQLLISGGLAIAAALFRDELERVCGPRHSRKEEGFASRWGQQQGEVVLGGRKVKLAKPRARRGRKEVILSSYAELQREDPLNDRAVEQMLIGVSTRKYHRSLEPVSPDLVELGASKSAVSRRFVAMSSAQLENAMSRPLGGEQWAALLVDGIQFFEHLIVIVMGIDTTGRKQVLAFREGSTENASLCRELLSGIVARGVPADQSILIVIDGGKGLRRAVTEVFGEYAWVQRCQVHKKRNVLDHLPDELRAQVRGAMSQAYAAQTYEVALRQLENLARTLTKAHPSGAESLREGLKETLTVKRLGLTGVLAKTLETTNPIENMNGGIRRITDRVKHCRGGQMALRWVASGALEASRGFRRLKGYREMPKLVAALRALDNKIKHANVREVG